MAEPLPEEGPTDLKPDHQLALHQRHDADLLTVHHSTTSPSRDVLQDPEKAESTNEKSSASSVRIEIGQDATDPDIVDWAGPDDPENPTNWSPATKWGIIAIVSAITFLTSVPFHRLVHGQICSSFL